MDAGRQTPPRQLPLIMQRKLAAMKAGTFKFKHEEVRRAQAVQSSPLGGGGREPQTKRDLNWVELAQPAKECLCDSRHLLHSAYSGAEPAIPTTQDLGQGVLDTLYSANGFDFDFSEKAYSDEFKDLGYAIYHSYNDSLKHEDLVINLRSVSISRETQNTVEKEETPGHSDVPVPEFFVQIPVSSPFWSAIKLCQEEMKSFPTTTQLVRIWGTMKEDPSQVRHWFASSSNEAMASTASKLPAQALLNMVLVVIQARMRFLQNYPIQATRSRFAVAVDRFLSGIQKSSTEKLNIHVFDI